MQAFEALGLRAELIRAIAERGFQEPTPIQQQAIPHLLSQTQDFIGLAQTGTGKTAAFGLPLLQHIDPNERQAQALVLAPTRELCMQIASDIEGYAQYLPGIRSVAVYGGTAIGPQIRQVKAGVQLIIATPGRLIDLIERRALSLQTVQYVVLDEADEMLNMGFRDAIDFILEQAISRRSTWLFSATMPDGVRRIASRFMHAPKEVSVGRQNTAAANIEHEYYVTAAHDRYEALKRIVDVHPDIYGIIFTRTKADAQEIADKLRREGYNIDALHGDLSQVQRDKVMGQFRERSLQLLIATDVAARGIDVDGITHVINYALPDETEVYTHRSGRTARAGKSGVCLSLIHTREFGKLREIERLVKVRFTRRQVPTGQEVCEKQFFHFINRLHDADISHGEFEQYLSQVRERFADMDKDELLARMAALEFNRFLDYYRHAKDLNVSVERRSAVREPSSRQAESGRVRLFINVGSKDGFYKASFLQFILDTSGLSKQVLGRIDLRETNSFVEVDSDAAQQMMRSLDGKNVKGRRIRMNRADQGAPSSYRGDRREQRPSSPRRRY